LAALQEEIVARTTLPLDAASLNRMLHAAGLSALHAVRRVIRMEELPLPGSDKIDYRALLERYAG
jgi:non-ribosomal peptide synthetase component E (peptide arylation enzyme)